MKKILLIVLCLFCREGYSQSESKILQIDTLQVIEANRKEIEEYDMVIIHEDISIYLDRTQAIESVQGSIDYMLKDTPHIDSLKTWVRKYVEDLLVIKDYLQRDKGELLTIKVPVQNSSKTTNSNQPSELFARRNLIEHVCDILEAGDFCLFIGGEEIDSILKVWIIRSGIMRLTMSATYYMHNDREIWPACPPIIQD